MRRATGLSVSLCLSLSVSLSLNLSTMQGPRCQSEDCLNLNVYCPAAKPELPGGYPVMFWIYGGAFNEGMNWGPLGLYDGTKLAAKGGVCVVATNYRLGVLSPLNALICVA